MSEQQKVVNLQSVDVIARLFDRSARRIQQLTQDGILPTVDGKYDLLPTIQRYIAYLYGQIDKKAKSDAEKRRDEASARLNEAKAQKAELELQEMQGTMHRSEDVADMTDDLIWTVRGLFLAIPGRVALDTAAASTAAETSEIVRAECCRALEELSRYEYDSEKYMERVRARTKMELNKADDDLNENSRQEDQSGNRKSDKARKASRKSNS